MQRMAQEAQVMNENLSFRDRLLYEVQKAFYDERGKGARYRLTTTAVSFVKERLGEKVSDIGEIKKYLEASGLVEGMNWSEDEISFKVQIDGCCLKQVRDAFTDAGLQPLSCPMANIIMNALEMKSSLSPELLPIEFEENTCNLTMAKIATSDVVEG
jgi:hypothetical protein